MRTFISAVVQETSQNSVGECTVGSIPIMGKTFVDFRYN